MLFTLVDNVLTELFNCESFPAVIPELTASSCGVVNLSCLFADNSATSATISAVSFSCADK